jgi:hypothetical protein
MATTTLTIVRRFVDALTTEVPTPTPRVPGYPVIRKTR